MPTYTFSDGQGNRIESNEKIGTRSVVIDGKRYSRVTEPEGFMLNTGAQVESQRDQIRKGYYRAENRGWRSKFSKQQIKRVWDL